MLKSLFGRKQTHNDVEMALERRLEEYTHRLSMLYEFSKVLVASNAEEITDLLLSSIGYISEVDTVSLSLADRDSLRLISVHGSLDEEVFRTNYKETPIWESFKSGEPFFGCFVGSIPLVAAFPLTLGERVYGVIALHGTSSLQIPEREIEFIKTMVDFGTLALRNAWNYRHVVNQAEVFKNKAVKDALTGLYNKGFMKECLQREIAMAQRHNRHLCVIMFDIDHFKSCNDTYGHPFGDLVIKTVASLAASCLREGDIAFRYGGEEFLVMMPTTSASEGKQVAERIRMKVMKQTYEYNSETIVQYTISLGVAELFMGEEGESMIQRADKALYRAKEGGRNQVCLWEKGKDG